MLGREPVDHAFYFAPFRLFAQGVVINAAFERHHAPIGILHHFFAFDHIAVTQTHFAAGGEPLPAFGRIDGKIVGFDIDGFRNRHFALAEFGMVRVVRRAAALRERFIIIHQFDFNRVEHGHHARGGIFQHFAHRTFEHAHVHHVFTFGNAHAFGKQAQSFGCVAAAAHAGNGGQTRIVPAFHMAFAHQLVELALGGDGIKQLQPRKFVLARVVVDGDIVEHPVIQRAVRFKFERAQRMGDVFDGIGNGVGVVIHRVDAPFVAGVVVVHAADAVNHRVAHIDVARGHVDFQAQGFAAVGKFAGFHAHK